MILKHEFVHMVNHLGLEDGELALAEIVWQKAERAMQGLPIQEAALLNKALIAPVKQPNQSKQLTREEVQFLVDLHRDLLNIGQQNMHQLTKGIQEAWFECDPENEETEESFEELNFLRSYQRRVKAHMRKLERIQHKLKKLR